MEGVSLLELAPLLFLGSVAAALVARWTSFPARYPVAFDLLGRPERFAERSALASLSLVVLGLASALALALARRQLAAGERSALREAMGGSALGAAYALAAFLGAEAARPLWASGGPWAAALGAGMSFLFAPALVEIVRARGAAGAWRPLGRRPPGSARRLGAWVLASATLGAALVLARLL